MKKTMLTAVFLICAAGAVKAGSLDELRAVSEIAAEVPLPPPPSPMEGADPFELRKVYPMPGQETWSGPFCVQFSAKTPLEQVVKILEAEELKAGEILKTPRGYYVRAALKESTGWGLMDREFSMMRVMRLTDYTSVSYVLVNKALRD